MQPLDQTFRTLLVEEQRARLRADAVARPRVRRRRFPRLALIRTARPNRAHNPSTI